MTQGQASAYGRRYTLSRHSTTTYYNASQYFQKQSVTDADGHLTTAMGVGTDTAGNAGDPDPNPGDRGQVLSGAGRGYNDSPAARSYTRSSSPTPTTSTARS